MTSRVTEMYLVRHTRSQWNDESRYQGQLDAPLGVTGLNQVNTIASMVPEGVFSALYSSPLSRARQLAEAIAAKTAIPLEIDSRLSEIAMGLWEGLVRDEIERQYPEMFREWYVRPQTVQFPGGESLHQVCGRANSFVETVFQERPGERVLVVSHNAVIAVLIASVLGAPFENIHRFRIRNGSISVLSGIGRPEAVESVDVVSHLTGSVFVISDAAEIPKGPIEWGQSI